MTYIIWTILLIIAWFYISCSNKKKKDSPGKFQYGFSRIKDSIKYFDKAIDDVDANSFIIIDEYYCKDKSQVFYHKTYRESKDYFLTKKHMIVPLQNCDAESFKSLDYGYATDKSSAWFNGSPFVVSDVESLQVLDLQFVKDKNHVYLQCKQIPHIHSPTFERINTNYAKDHQQYYFIQSDQVEYTLKPIHCNYATYQLLENYFSKDQEHVFYHGEIIKGSAPSSFQIIGAPYSKDVSHVYYENKIITNADPNTFELFKENELSSGGYYYAKDKNHIYLNNINFEGIDAGSFKILNEKYCSDKNGIYYNMKKVKNADASTFKIFPHYIGNADAEDKNHRYGDGKVVE